MSLLLECCAEIILIVTNGVYQVQSATQVLYADLDMSPTPSSPRHTYLNLGEVAGQLRDLTNADKEFLWANQHFEAFTKANELVSKAPHLRYFDVYAWFCQLPSANMVLVQL